MAGLRTSLSLGISPRESMHRFIEIVQMAEQLGAEQIWVIDSQLAMKDCATALTLCATHTTRLRFGPGVSNPITHDLTAIANQAVTLSELSGGRMVTGIGSGDSAVKPLGLKPAKVAAMREAVTGFRTLVGGGTIQRGGKDVKLPFISPQRPPIYMAASGPRTLSLAGEVADGAIVMGAVQPELVRQNVQRVRDGARSAGRDPATVDVDVWVPIAIDDDIERAVDSLRSWVVAHCRFLLKEEQLPPSLEAFRPEMERAAGAYVYGEHLSRSASHAALVSPELVQAMTVCGSPAQCSRRLTEILAASGADRFTFTLMSGGRETRLQRLFAEVVPHVRREVGQ